MTRDGLNLSLFSYFVCIAQKVLSNRPARLAGIFPPKKLRQLLRTLFHWTDFQKYHNAPSHSRSITFPCRASFVRHIHRDIRTVQNSVTILFFISAHPQHPYTWTIENQGQKYLREQQVRSHFVFLLEFLPLPLSLHVGSQSIRISCSPPEL